MKIALLSFDYPPETGEGDAGAYTFYQAQALARLGHDVTVFAGALDAGTGVIRDRRVAVRRSHRNGPFHRLGDRLGQVGLREIGAHLRQGADTVAGLRRELHDSAFDVIEVAASGGEAPLLTLCQDLPVVVRLHDPVVAAGDRADTRAMDRLLLRTFEQIGLQNARAVTASSRWLLNQLVASTRVGGPTAVIPNGIDLALTDTRAEVDGPRDQLRILCPARLTDAHEREVVSHLALAILPARSDVSMVVTGGGPDGEVFDEIRRRLAATGAEGQLIHVAEPPLEERRALAARADILVYPALRQSCPYACLESMAAGCPVVAGDSGGLPELILANATGLLARDGTPKAFESALRTLVRQGARRARMGEQARRRVENRFAADDIAARTLDFYSSALGLTAPAAPAVREANQPLGPDNWFEAWWLRQSSRVAPDRAVDTSGEPLFGRLAIEALGFAEAVMSRSWREEHGDWDSAEGVFIHQLYRFCLDYAAEQRRRGAEPPQPAQLQLPGLDHPLFDGDRARFFVDETWRIEALPEYAEWLIEQTQSEGFVARAAGNVHLRRLAVAAAQVRPSAESYNVLKALYRDKTTHNAVVAEDREFFEAGGAGAQFRQAIAAAGLHAPLVRPLLHRKKAARTQQMAADGDTATPPHAEVTVLIPSYKHQKFVAKAIRSALDQTYPQVRVLVVDDNSPDRTVQEARKIEDPRLQVRSRDHNLGLGESIHEALATIETPYIALLNSDDVFHAERLERCIEILESDPGAGLVATGLDLMDRSGRRLTAGNSCIVDVGPQAHGWVSWYTQIVEEFTSDDDRIEPAALLRHNHLATSSNMVFRTDWLKAHFADARSLKYCVDWMLFLLAAVEGALRYHPAALLGYRFHDNNTVWFRHGGRSDYVLEVNQVVARALRRFVEVRSRDQGIASAREELAALLREHVIRHGETEGFALLYADLTGPLPASESTDGEPELDRLVDELLARKSIQRTFGQVAEQVELPPWQLADLARRSDRLKLDAFVADGFTERARSQARELRRLKAEIGDAQRHAVDLRVRIDQASTDAEALRQERRQGTKEIERLRKVVEQLRQERGEATHQLERLQAALDGLRQERDRGVQQLERLQATVDGLRQERDRGIEQLRALRQERDRGIEQLRALRQERDRGIEQLERLQTDLDALRSERDRITDKAERLERRQQEITRKAEEERARAAQQLRRTRERADQATRHGEHLAEQLRQRGAESRRNLDYLALMRQVSAQRREALRRIPEASEWRLGRLLLERCKLRRPFEALLHLHAGVTVRAGRARARRQRRRGDAATQGRRVVLACDGPFPSLDSSQLIGEAKGLLAAGFEPAILSFGRGPDDLLGDSDRALLRRRQVLYVAPGLQRSDRAHFEKTAPRGLTDLTQIATPGTLAKSLCFARSAEALGAGFVHVLGLGEASAVAHGAATLLDIPFGVAVGGPDLPILDGRPERIERLLSGAAVVVADCTTTADALVEIVGSTLPKMHIRPPAVSWLPEGDRRSWNGTLHATVAPAANFPELLPIAEAVKLAVEGGTDLRVEMIDRPRHDSRQPVELLRLHVQQAGIEDRFTFVESAPAAIEHSLTGTSVMVATSWLDAEHDSTGIPVEVIAAMSAGVPIVAIRGSALDGLVRHRENGLLVPRQDPGALARALQEIAADPELRQRMGRAAHERFVAEFAPKVSSAEWYETVRRLLES